MQPKAIQCHHLRRAFCNNSQQLEIVNYCRGWSRADLRLVYRFWGHLIWAPKFMEGRKRKTKVLQRNRKLSPVNLFSKLNIESENINAVNKTTYHSTLILLYFRHFQSSFNTVRRTSDSAKAFFEHLEAQILKILPRHQPWFSINLPTPKLEL